MAENNTSATWNNSRTAVRTAHPAGFERSRKSPRASRRQCICVRQVRHWLIIVTIFCVAWWLESFNICSMAKAAFRRRAWNLLRRTRVNFRLSRDWRRPRRRDMRRMRDAEDKMLNTLRLGRSTAGMVRIPIDRAMDLVVQRGLPARAEAGVQSAAAGVTVPTRAGLGPIMQQSGGPLARQIQKGGIAPAGGQVACCATPLPAVIACDRCASQAQPGQPAPAQRPSACRTPTSSPRFPARCKGVGIDQRLDAQVPLNLVFHGRSRPHRAAFHVLHVGRSR